MWIRHFVYSFTLLLLCALVTLCSRHHPPGLKDVEDLFRTAPICITWHITILKISDVICQDDSSWSVNMLCSRSCLVAINTSLNHFSFAGTPCGCAKASCIFASVHVSYLISLLFTTYVTTLTVVRTVWRRVSFQHFKKFISARDYETPTCSTELSFRRAK